jgi:hypothetical protein
MLIVIVYEHISKNARVSKARFFLVYQLTYSMYIVKIREKSLL